MNLTNISEKGLLIDWAKANEKSTIFRSEADWKRDSYYIDRMIDQNEILEYAPENVGDLIKLFQEIWDKENDEKVMRIIAMAAIKMRQSDVKKEKEEEDPISKIPEYIYVF